LVSNKLIIISWQAQASGSKLHEYIIHVFNVAYTLTSASTDTFTTFKYTYTELTKNTFFGIFYDETTPSINGPKVLISPSFNQIIAYGKDSASTSFSMGRFINYKLSTISEISFAQTSIRSPSPITSSFNTSEVSISLNDDFIYLRDTNSK